MTRRLERGSVVLVRFDPAEGREIRKTRPAVVVSNNAACRFDAVVQAVPVTRLPERDLRPSTTFRKVTGGFRSDWGGHLYAGVRSTLNTGRRQGLSALQAIEAAINGQPPFRPG